jgi:hypothetical protein
MLSRWCLRPDMWRSRRPPLTPFWAGSRLHATLIDPRAAHRDILCLGPKHSTSLAGRSCCAPSPSHHHGLAGDGRHQRQWPGRGGAREQRDYRREKTRKGGAGGLWGEHDWSSWLHGIGSLIGRHQRRVTQQEALALQHSQVLSHAHASRRVAEPKAVSKPHLKEYLSDQY